MHESNISLQIPTIYTPANIFITFIELFQFLNTMNWVKRTVHPTESVHPTEAVHLISGRHYLPLDVPRFSRLEFGMFTIFNPSLIHPIHSKV